MSTRTSSFLSDAECEEVIGVRQATGRAHELSSAEYKTQERIRSITQHFWLDGAKTFHSTGLSISRATLSARSGQSWCMMNIDALPLRRGARIGPIGGTFLESAVDAHRTLTSNRGGYFP